MKKTNKSKNEKKRISETHKVSEIEPKLKEKLVEAALKIFKTKHYLEMNFREIAELAGVSHMSVYRYFKTKESFLSEISLRGYFILNSELEKARKISPLEPEKQLCDTALAYYEFVKSNPIFAELMFGPLNEALEKENPEVTKAGEITLEMILSIVRNGQLVGLFSNKEETHLLALQLWAYIHGLSLLSLNNALRDFHQGPPDIVRFVKNLICGISAKT